MSYHSAQDSRFVASPFSSWLSQYPDRSSQQQRSHQISTAKDQDTKRGRLPKKSETNRSTAVKREPPPYRSPTDGLPSDINPIPNSYLEYLSELIDSRKEASYSGSDEEPFSEEEDPIVFRWDPVAFPSVGNPFSSSWCVGSDGSDRGSATQDVSEKLRATRLSFSQWLDSDRVISTAPYSYPTLPSDFEPEYRSYLDRRAEKLLMEFAADYLIDQLTSRMRLQNLCFLETLYQVLDEPQIAQSESDVVIQKSFLPQVSNNLIQIHSMDHSTHQSRARRNFNVTESFLVEEFGVENGLLESNISLPIKWVSEAIGKAAISQWKDLSGRKKRWNTFSRTRIRPGSLEKLSMNVSPKMRCRIRPGVWNYQIFNVPLVLAKSSELQAFPLLYRENRQDYGRQGRKRRVLMDEDVDTIVNQFSTWNESSSSSHETYQIIRSESGPPERILRLTFTGKAADCEYSTILSKGHVFLGRYIIECFKENNSHADVYEVRDQLNPTQKYVAHVFLSGPLPGNWGSAKTKRMKRFRAQGKVIASFKTSDARTSFILKDEEMPLPEFSLDSYSLAGEFPPLPSSVEQDPSIQKASIMQDRNESYAEVVKRTPKKKRKRTRNRKKQSQVQPCLAEDYIWGRKAGLAWSKVENGRTVACQCSDCRRKLDEKAWRYLTVR